MANDNIIKKIENLLRLSTSSNIHEAALAASRAQQLAEKYNIALEILKGKQDIKELNLIVDYYKVYNEPFKSNLFNWEFGLAQMLSKYYWCKVFKLPEVDLNIVGMNSDILLFESMFDWLQGQINILILEEKIEKDFIDVFSFGSIHFLNEQFEKGVENARFKMKEIFPEAKSAIISLHNKFDLIDEFLKNKKTIESDKFSTIKSRFFEKGRESANKIILTNKILD